MKIITNNKIYVQKKDLAHLLEIVALTNIMCPNSIMNNIFNPTLIMNRDEELDFVMYEGDEIISFFKELDYIVDYNEIKDLSDIGIVNYVQTLCDSLNPMVEEYNLMLSGQNYKKREELEAFFRINDLKINDIRNYLMYKHGNLNMNIPIEEIEQQVNNKVKNKVNILNNLLRKENNV